MEFVQDDSHCKLVTAKNVQGGAGVWKDSNYLMFIIFFLFWVIFGRCPVNSFHLLFTLDLTGTFFFVRFYSSSFLGA